jgi:hypothetical protein
MCGGSGRPRVWDVETKKTDIDLITSLEHIDTSSRPHYKAWLQTVSKISFIKYFPIPASNVASFKIPHVKGASFVERPRGYLEDGGVPNVRNDRSGTEN